MYQSPISKAESPIPPGPLPNHNPPEQSLNHLLQESIRGTQMEIQHQKQHIKHWLLTIMVAGAGKGDFQFPDTAAVSPFSFDFHTQK